MSRYTYGDSDLAGDRLELVARLFAPASRAFLLAGASQRPRLALDLGCGPGATTDLVRASTAAATTAPSRSPVVRGLRPDSGSSSPTWSAPTCPSRPQTCSTRACSSRTSTTL